MLWINRALAVTVAGLSLYGMFGVVPPLVQGATTISVTTTDDELTTNGRCSLREAITNANANARPYPDCPAGDVEDTILLGAGMYRLTPGPSVPHDEPDGRLDLDLIGSTTIVGGGPGVTIIDGNHDGSVYDDRVIDVGAGSTAALRNLTIQNGTGGGGLWGEYSGAAGIRNSGTMTLTNVFVSGNRGTGIENTGTMTVSASTINGNVSLANAGIDNSGTLTLLDVEVAGNLAPYSLHGGYTGGIHNTGTLTMRGGTIWKNVGGRGLAGGILHVGWSAELTNVTIGENRSFFNGGGIVASAPMTLTNVTIWDNTADSAPAGSAQNLAVVSGMVRAKNTIVANHAGIPNCSGSLVSDGNNLESGSSCGFTAAGDLQNADPMLGPPANNGGPTSNYELLTGSPAIDAGTNSGCPVTDQRGAPRPRDGNADGLAICDIGAFEAPLWFPPTPTPTPTSTFTPAPTFTPTPPPTVTLTPTLMPQACAPRPGVRVQSTSVAEGVLQVTLVAQSLPSTPSNGLQQLTITRLDNATVQVNGAPVRVGAPVALGGAGSLTFLVNRVTPGPATTVQFVVRDACGDWPSFVGLGPATPTPTLTPTPVACAPRPNVRVQVTLAGAGVQRVTLVAQTLPSTPSNGLHQLTVTRLDNATVLVNGTPVSVGAPLALGGTESFTFLVNRVTPGVATTVQFVVRDRCGEWPTFVGGGPHAW